QLQSHINESLSEAQLRKITSYYHMDHGLVEALQDHNHQRHDAAWTIWLAQVVTILRRTSLHWSSDVSIDIDDLAQVARIELVRSLSGFHYSSRFVTWAQRVIVQSVQRAIRDSLALKRSGRPDSLDQYPWVDATIGEAEHPEVAASARVLVEQVEAVLAAQP